MTTEREDTVVAAEPLKAKAAAVKRKDASSKATPESAADTRPDVPTEDDNKVKTNLEHRTASMDAQDLVFQVVVPTEDEIEIRDGQRRTVSRKIFPGYILVQMVELREDDPKSNQAWFVVRNTPGVTGFVGSGSRPVPLGDDEVRRILKQMRVEEPRIKVGFAVGESVRIIDGPFLDFVGTVDELNLEKGKVKVLVSFFGRETPVELDFLQVERL